MFTLTHQDPKTNARRSRLQTAHGAVELSAFMPAGTLGTVKGVADCVYSSVGKNSLPSCFIHDFAYNDKLWSQVCFVDLGGYMLEPIGLITLAGRTYSASAINARFAELQKQIHDLYGNIADAHFQTAVKLIQSSKQSNDPNACVRNAITQLIVADEVLKKYQYKRKPMGLLKQIWFAFSDSLANQYMCKAPKEMFYWRAYLNTLVGILYLSLGDEQDANSFFADGESLFCCFCLLRDDWVEFHCFDCTDADSENGGIFFNIVGPAFRKYIDDRFNEDDTDSWFAWSRKEVEIMKQLLTFDGRRFLDIKALRLKITQIDSGSCFDREFQALKTKLAAIGKDNLPKGIGICQDF